MIFPGWVLEDFELWQDWTAPCGIQTALQVLENTFYSHTTRIVDDLDHISYNGIVSISINQIK